MASWFIKIKATVIAEYEVCDATKADAIEEAKAMLDAGDSPTSIECLEVIEAKAEKQDVYPNE